MWSARCCLVFLAKHTFYSRGQALMVDRDRRHDDLVCSFPRFRGKKLTHGCLVWRGFTILAPFVNAFAESDSCCRIICHIVLPPKVFRFFSSGILRRRQAFEKG